MISKKAICIVGIGKVGSALAIELSDAGYNVKYLIGHRNVAFNKVAKYVKGSVISGKLDEKIAADSDVIFICVQDSEISEIVTELKEYDLKWKFLIHTSGSLSSEEFSPLKVSKKDIASFHPIQTFTKVSQQNNKLLSGIYFGIEGGVDATAFLKTVANKLGGESFTIKAKDKPLYHIASVIASNFLVANLSIVSEILGKLGVKGKKSYEVYKGIIEQTLNNVKLHGDTDSITGPIDRNDKETLLKHKDVLKKEMPEISDYYKEASKMVSKVAYKKGSLTKKEYGELVRFLNKK